MLLNKNVSLICIVLTILLICFLCISLYQSPPILWPSLYFLFQHRNLNVIIWNRPFFQFYVAPLFLKVHNVARSLKFIENYLFFLFLCCWVYLSCFLELEQLKYILKYIYVLFIPLFGYGYRVSLGSN